MLTAADIDDVSAAFPKPFPGNVIIALSEETGLNGDLMFAQMLLETGNGASEFWVERNNPAGIGAVDATPGDALTFPDPASGIRAQYAHMLSYVDGENNALKEDDPRYWIVRANHPDTISTLGELGNGTWASDPAYAGKLRIIANNLVARYTKGSGGTVAQGGKVMVPDQSYSLPVRTELRNNAHSFVNRPTNPDGRILAIVKHVTDGEDLDGALSWNRNPDVKASAHFYIDRDGTVVQDVSLFNGAWANGVLANDTLPPQFDDVKANGWAINDFTISIEHVGKPEDNDFPTPAQLTADARLTADLCDYFHVPVDEEHILGHYRFDAVNRARCPGPHWDFAADVRAVSQLLNGPDGQGEPNDANSTIPAGATPDGSDADTPASGGNGTGTDNGGEQSGSGVPPMAGTDGDGGKQSADAGARIALADGIYAYRHTTSGDGRGFTVGRDGESGAIRVGHGFYDAYTRAGGIADGFVRFGPPLCSEYATVVPGVVNAANPGNAVVVQIYQYAVFVWDGRAVSRLDAGRLTAYWLAQHGNALPADMHWTG